MVQVLDKYLKETGDNVNTAVDSLRLPLAFLVTSHNWGKARASHFGADEAKL